MSTLLLQCNSTVYTVVFGLYIICYTSCFTLWPGLQTNPFMLYTIIIKSKKTLVRNQSDLYRGHLVLTEQWHNGTPTKMCLISNTLYRNISGVFD